MGSIHCSALCLTTAVNTLASAMAGCLSEEELELAAAILTQLGDTLATISVRRGLCGGEGNETQIV